jgi:Tc5 transposase DNA-binding domain
LEEELLKWLDEYSRRNLPITDNSIRQRARGIARLRNIPEDKFKASSGWIENFKSRHNIRRGIWLRAKKNIYLRRIMNNTNSEDSVPLPQTNPASEQCLGGMSAPPSGGVDLKSLGSPEPEDQAGWPGDHEMTESQLSHLPSSWSDNRIGHNASASMEQSVLMEIDD